MGGVHLEEEIIIHCVRQLSIDGDGQEVLQTAYNSVVASQGVFSITEKFHYIIYYFIINNRTKSKAIKKSQIKEKIHLTFKNKFRPE